MKHNKIYITYIVDDTKYVITLQIPQHARAQVAHINMQHLHVATCRISLKPPTTRSAYHLILQATTKYGQRASICQNHHKQHQ